MARTTFSGPVASLNGFTTVALTSGKQLTIQAPAALSADTTLTFPNGAGSAGQQLTTDGTGVLTWAASGGVDLSSPPTIGNTTPNTGAVTTLSATSVGVTNTSSSTSLFEPVVVSSTLTGVGVTGGRAKFATTINSAAGGFSNALKADVAYGASGSTSGLGSSFVAELTLSAGTSAGTYAPLELELNLPTGAATGTLTSFIHASMQGDDVATMDTNGRFLNIVGVTAGATKMWVTGTTLGTAAGGLRCRIAGTDYWLPFYAAEPTA
jgi:hypothetical protein